MRKGSITLYLCLVLGVLVSLVSVALFSARKAAARVVLASASEQGMYSLFSRFDRTLFDEYGILAIDGGYNTEELKLGALLNEAEEVVGYLTGSSSSFTGPENLTHLKQEKGEVTGYLLLTDGQGTFLKEQVLRALAGKKAAGALQGIRDSVAENSSIMNMLENSVDGDSIEDAYQNLKSQPAEAEAVATAARVGVFPYRMSAFSGQAQAAELLTALTAEEMVPSSQTVPETSENPIEMIRGMKKLGILNLVLPRGRTVSAGEMDADTVSKRSLQQGMGIIQENDTSLVDKILLGEYLMESFDDFTEAGKEEKPGISYQVEYAIGGKNSDRENLKAVMNRLLVIREAANYVYLMQDPAKQEELQAVALSISTLIGLPIAEPAVAEMLRLCWAFGESVLDLRELLQGGKIPMLKDASSWQLSLNMLTHIQEGSVGQHSSAQGLDYKGYLRLLLATKSEEKLTDALEDLLEHQIRKKEGREGFRLDNCIVDMKIRFRARQDRLFLLEAERSYNYKQ